MCFSVETVMDKDSSSLPDKMFKTVLISLHLGERTFSGLDLNSRCALFNEN